MNFQEAKEAFERLFKNEMDSDEAKTFLVELYQRGESYEEIAAAADVMRSYSIPLEIPDTLRNQVIDVVGTGGDKSGSFNISTTVSFVLASIGSYVAKHGNRSITSKSGSADVLDILGINLNLNPEQQATMLQECGFCFMFAVNHHPAMKHIMPIRKSLDHRTIFNILGPLTNPAGARKKLLGVFAQEFIAKMAQALRELNASHAMVVSSKDGMDEISVSDITYYAHLKDGHITEGVFDPVHYGIKIAPFDSIKGGEAKENAQIIYDIFEGKEQGPKKDIVLVNAGVALMVDNKARDIQEGIEMAKEAIDSQKALEKLKSIIETSKKL